MSVQPSPTSIRSPVTVFPMTLEGHVTLVGLPSLEDWMLLSVKVLPTPTITPLSLPKMLLPLTMH